MRIFLTPLLGAFNVDLLANFASLKYINISDCQKVDPDKFTSEIGSCKEVVQIVMVGCKQFTHWQIIKICSSLPKLTSMNALNCTTLISVHAYQIVTTADKLMVLKVEPKWIKDDKCNWSQLVNMFMDIDFGPKVKKFVKTKSLSLQYKKVK